ncbi:T9SS type A sorting domain-containing protein [Chryseobacterium turcicum]|uniref:T9SS type A sorting domain-containing protein n=1 Tax=Chryseobacterium turcicum TaxID=2898076 RepID=A0A9Q3V4K0_9FLAO|nr:T9SS type A sorting domain-containing protein [Chryseobacterium turcicum]MCD1116590.1 T9SS type A sorting domain-containing protein [Chryseobacterium turcicum]
MKKSLKNLCTLFFLLPGLFISQTYQWQWAKQAGGQTGSVSSGFDYINDESIRDIAVDSDNNTYYLATIWAQNQNLDGTAVTSYHQRDLFLFSTDCQGNIRWSRTIGGTGTSEHAWNIELDNNGGLYIMTNIFNQGYANQPSSITTHFDDTHTIPLITATDNNTVDQGVKTGYLLKYNTTNGNLIWSKPLQGDVTMALQQCDSQMMYMDSAKNIHAILGFCAGTHLGGLINVPSTYTSSYQYFLVKFNYDGGNMTPASAVLLPITGFVSAGMFNGHVNMLYDDTINQYYLAGKRRAGSYSSLVDFSFNNIPVTKEAYLIAFSVNGTTVSEAWRKEINTGQSSPDDEIHSIIKDTNSSGIYISGRYFSDAGASVSFGTYTFPPVSYNLQRPFVMKLNSSGNVQWAKIADGIPAAVNSNGYRFMKGRIVQNGNEIGFAHGSWGSGWGNYNMVRPSGDRADPILVRLNKDSGSVLEVADVLSNYNTVDEFTAIAVDNDGNYVLGGFFHQQLFTDANDNVPTMALNVTTGKSQNFFTKYAKSVCSGLSVEETALEAGLQFYPNPVKDVLSIKSKNKLESFEVYSSVRQNVLRGNLQNTNAQINMSGLTAGVYYLKVKTEKSVVTEKIIKK